MPRDERTIRRLSNRLADLIMEMRVAGATATEFSRMAASIWQEQVEDDAKEDYRTIMGGTLK